MEEIKRYECTALSALLTEAQCRRNKETAEFTGTPGIYACCLACKGLMPELVAAPVEEKRRRKSKPTEIPAAAVTETGPAERLPEAGKTMPVNHIVDVNEMVDDCPALTIRFQLPEDREIYEKLCLLSTDIESDLLALLHVMCERDLLVEA